MTEIKSYSGRVPACGCFCGGCPNFIRERNPCPGAQFTDRCLGCKSYHLCCESRGITHCYQCSVYPCARFKAFAKCWLKYGQDFLENQVNLQEMREVGFLELWNGKTEEIG
ncbi:MAG TPA: DUF3795 domain-containing protein [Pelolinea sp.]|nr:DUF3795 domain-containing protein [Pelolinea sp.]